MEDHRDDLVVDRRRLPRPDGGLHRPEPRPGQPLPDHDRVRRLHRRRAGRRSSSGSPTDADYDADAGLPRPVPRDPRRHAARRPGFGNGRFARNVLEAAIGRHAWRLRDVAEPTVEQLRELLAEDLDDEPADQPRGCDGRVSVEPDQHGRARCGAGGRRPRAAGACPAVARRPRAPRPVCAAPSRGRRESCGRRPSSASWSASSSLCSAATPSGPAVTRWTTPAPTPHSSSASSRSRPT